MKETDPYKVLKLEFDGIKNATAAYTSDNLVNNYLDKLEVALQVDDGATILYLIESLSQWYQENIRMILTNQFVTQKEQYIRINAFLSDTYQKLQGYVFPDKKTSVNAQTETCPKPVKIFISHSSKDKEYVAQIVNLLDGMGLSNEQILCSSLPGYMIPNDTNIFDYLREQFLEYNLHMIFVHSRHYYASPVSLNEMGAAWVTRSKSTSILLPGFGFKEMTGVVNADTISMKLDGDVDELKDRLNQFYDGIVSEFSLTKKSAIIWEQKRNAFIRDSNAIVPIPVEKKPDDGMQNLSEQAIILLTSASTHPQGQIVRINSIIGLTIQAGNQTVNDPNNHRDTAKWEAALDSLITYHLVKPCGSKGEVFQLTESGYTYADKFQENNT